MPTPAAIKRPEPPTKTSSKGLALIKRSEGLKLRSYKDAVGIWTIGYGHTGPEVKQGQIIDSTKADDLLVQDVAWAEAAVRGKVTTPLTQGQFDALVSFVFNVGAGALAKSTLLRKLNSGDYAGAADEFLRWNKAGGKVLPGLTMRRAAERELFING